MDLLNHSLTADRLKALARQFCGGAIEVGTVTGPLLGNKIEAAFVEYLEHEAGYWQPSGKYHCDIPHLNADVKALQVQGKRGGAAKIHGYSKGGPPRYDLLLFTYIYAGTVIAIHGSYWIPESDIDWVRAEHYLFSVADRHLKKWSL